MGEAAEQRGRRADRWRLEQELGPAICSHPVVAQALDQILEGERGVESALIDIVRALYAATLIEQIGWLVERRGRGETPG